MSANEDRATAGKVVRLTRKNRKCPICAKPAVQNYRPFCSKRCADIDLGRWLGETYRVPGEPVPMPMDAEGVDAESVDDEGEGPE
jgi:endogenous inhibitor of DNA gyrase (YacG/DUF329 family)